MWSWCKPAGGRRLGRLWKGRCSNWETHFLSAWPFIPFLFLLSEVFFHARPNDNRIKVSSHAFPTTALHPRKLCLLCFRVEGWSEREEQISNDLVNIPRDAPVPPLYSSSSPPTSISQHTPRHESTGWHRAQKKGEVDTLGVQSSTALRSIPPLAALIMTLRGCFAGPRNKNPDRLHIVWDSVFLPSRRTCSFLFLSSFLSVAFGLTLITNSLHPIWENSPFTESARCTQESLMLTLIVPIPAAQ